MTIDAISPPRRSTRPGLVSPGTIIAGAFAFLLVAAALLAPFIAPHDPFNPATLDLMDGMTPPMEPNAFTGKTFYMGTDNQGRDVLSSILYGSRVSLLVAFSATLLSLFLGVGAGLISGYAGSTIDAVIMRIADAQLTFPTILVALLIFGIAQGLVPPSRQENAAVWILIFAIGFSNWPQFARTVRSAVMVERRKDYVAAARLIGVGHTKILLKHILPNITGPVLVIATIGLALAVIEEATLSYLGVGVPPTKPSLGTLIRIGQQFLFSGEWWIIAFPAATLVTLALSVNLLGDRLRDALNPRLRNNRR
ncbi:ABC transporter permease [Agrobacterium rosae]|uniref:Dipeptide transport system permease protein DppC n=1 Tax=Agrobacterium rosae TaxID=1972867 RepID=A0A1R3TX22_9HYPH|nr:ABC transporter permease [Agrobacterium rosae]SCX31225.1 Dipeptide transport system permease protein DppC [Agrobacterium rosae]